MAGAVLSLLAVLTVSAAPGPVVQIQSSPAVVVRNAALVEAPDGWRLSAFVCRPLGAVGGWPTLAEVEMSAPEGAPPVRSWTPVPRLSGAHSRIGCRPLSLRLGSSLHAGAVAVVRFR